MRVALAERGEEKGRREKRKMPRSCWPCSDDLLGDWLSSIRCCFHYDDEEAKTYRRGVTSARRPARMSISHCNFHGIEWHRVRHLEKFSHAAKRSERPTLNLRNGLETSDNSTAHCRRPRRSGVDWQPRDVFWSTSRGRDFSTAHFTTTYAPGPCSSTTLVSSISLIVCF